MAEIFYKIQIEGIYLTQTGLTGGRKCKTSVSGVDALSMDYIRTVNTSRDGTPIIQTYPYTRGKPIEILIDILPKAVGEDLIELFNDSMLNQATLTVVGTEAETPDFTATCEFLSFNFRLFSRNAWNQVVIKLITT